MTLSTQHLKQDDDPRPLSPLGRVVQSLGMAQMQIVAESVEQARDEPRQGHPVETAEEPKNVIGQADEIRKFRRRRAAAQATAMCGASSVPDFLEAVAWYQDALEQIAMDGACIECGRRLIGNESPCPWCGCVQE